MKDIFVNFKKTGIISVCFLSSLLSGYSQRIVVSPIIPGGGSSGSLTGSYTFTSPLSEAAGVVTLPIAIANLNTNTPVTNKWNAWQFWCDPVSTNTYHAENRGLGIKTNSTDFSALLQSILNRGMEGFSFKFEPNPFYTNAYVMTNTVVVTNWGTWSGDLAGNPTVVFRAAPSLAGPLFQLGAYGMQIGGISGWRDIRFEGDQGATNCTGVELRNVVEPIFVFCEFTGFKAASIRVASTNAMYWTYVDNCWFVQKWDSSQGITFSQTPIENQSQCHFRISGSTFGGTAGNGIIVSNWFPSLNISGNKFFGAGMNDGIGIYAGEDLTIANNDFQNLSSFPIYFYDQATATNFSSSVTDNSMAGDGPIVVLGDKVQGVFLSGNSAASGTDPVFLTGNNGFPVNFDRAELRLGFLPVTNRVLFADANGKVTYVTGSSAETEYVKKDGTVGTPSGGGGTNFSGLVITNATEYTVLNLGTSTNVTLPWGTTNHVVWSPAAANGAALAMSGTAGGAGGTNDQTIDMTLIWPSGATALTLPTNGPNGSPVFVMTGPSTNRLKFRYDGYRFWIASGQQPSTGTGYTEVMQTNATLYTPTVRYVPTEISGVGGANTNFTLLSTQPEVYINGFTNVSIRAVMGYDSALVDYWTCIITNGSGSARTLEFSAVTNNWRFNGVYGTNAPSSLTNATRLEISVRQHGTNVQVLYSYTPWP